MIPTVQMEFNEPVYLLGYYWFRQDPEQDWKIIKIVSLRAKRPKGQYRGPLANPDEGEKIATHSMLDTSRDAGRFLENWNSLGAPFSKCLVVSSERGSKIRRRFSESFFRDHWQAAVLKLQTCPFLRGENEKKWVATVDWFLRPGSVGKIIEGIYEEKNIPKRGGNRARSGAQIPV